MSILTLAFFQPPGSSPPLDEGENMNSVDDKDFSADHESVVESHNSPPAEVKQSEAMPGRNVKRTQKHECVVCKKTLSSKQSLVVHIRNVDH